MWWVRNLFFIGLVLAGAVGLKALLYPPPVPGRGRHFDAARLRASDFPPTVTAVNAAFREEWTAKGLKPAPAAAPLAVARRLSLALTGTIPSLQEIRQFEAYQGEERLQWWLEGLLRDRRFADYFAERLLRASVGTEDGPFLEYRRRRFASWLSDQVLANRSWGETVRQMIASEGLWTDKPAANFVTVTIDAKQKPDPVRLAGQVARAFLGVRLDCAECHDHPFEKRWKQRDFQGLAAFFGQTRLRFTGIYDAEGDYQVDKPGGEKVTIPPRVPFHPELLPAQGKPRDRLARWVTDPGNKYFARAAVLRVWALMFGRPFQDEVESLTSEQDFPRPLEILADDFKAHDYDLHRLIRLIAATEVFQLDSGADQPLTAEHDAAWAVFPLGRLRPEQVAGSILQASSLKTVDGNSHILVRLVRYAGETSFVRRHGDTGTDEFDARAGTIPQRLLLMNGDLVKEKTQVDLFNASAQIATLAPDNRVAVETAYLAVLTRRPTATEASHFEQRLAGAADDQERSRRLEDLYWALVNSTEFSWNH